jgi:hypothetical protein
LTIVDVEVIIIVDRGLFTTTSGSTGEIFKRRSLKIRDESGDIDVTL